MSELAVVIPTRSRPHNMAPLLNEWHNTDAFDVADLVIAVDADDMLIDQYHSALLGLRGVTVYVLPEWQPMVPKLNRVALDLTEKYPVVAFAGDDHLPRTNKWAHLLVQDHYGTRKPQIVYGRDGHQDERLPTWWSMDSRIIRALGRMVPAPVQHLYCDNSVLQLGKAANCLLYDSRIELEHMHPFFGKSQPDAQYTRVNRPQQYDRDGSMFRSWMELALEDDASLVRSIGG